MTAVLALVAAAAVGGAVGCGGSDDPVNPPIKTVSAFAEQTARAMCAWQFQCCSRFERAILTGSAAVTEDDCVAYSRLRLDEMLANAASAVREGRLSLDPTRAGACVDRFRDGACNPPATDLMTTPSTPWTILAGCADPFVGKVRTGGQCFLSDECAAGSQCLTPGGLYDDTSPIGPDGQSTLGTLGLVQAFVGVCHPYQQLGQPCSLNSECDPARNLYCRRGDFRCAHPGGEGETCTTDIDPMTGSLRTLVACDGRAGLVCAAGFCRRLSLQGEPCLTFDLSVLPCDPRARPPLLCVGSSFNGNGICQPAGRAGDPCGGAALAPCEGTLACRSPPGVILGTCGTPPAAGEPCTIDQRCAPPAVCDQMWNMCLVPGTTAPGQSCASDEECSTLTCVSMLEPGVGLCFVQQDPNQNQSPTCSGENASVTYGGNIRPTRLTTQPAASMR